MGGLIWCSVWHGVVWCDQLAAYLQLLGDPRTPGQVNTVVLDGEQLVHHGLIGPLRVGVHFARMRLTLQATLT